MRTLSYLPVRTSNRPFRFSAPALFETLTVVGMSFTLGCATTRDFGVQNNQDVSRVAGVNGATTTGTAPQETELQRMQRLAEETCRKYYCGTGVTNGVWHTGVVGIRTPKGGLTIGAQIGTNAQTGDIRDDVTIFVNNKLASKPISLAPLRKMLTEIDPNAKLEYVSVVVVGTTSDPQIGEHTLFHVFPVASPTSSIAAIVPRLDIAFVHCTSAVFTDQIN